MKKKQIKDLEKTDLLEDLKMPLLNLNSVLM